MTEFRGCLSLFGCQNILSKTGWLKKTAVLEAQKPKIKALEDSASSENHFLVHRLALSLQQKLRERAPCNLFYKATNFILDVSTLMTYLSLKGPHPNAITLGVRVSTYGFEENTNIQSVTEGKIRILWVVWLKTQGFK